jgi:hypothetical protein
MANFELLRPAAIGLNPVPALTQLQSAVTNTPGLGRHHSTVQLHRQQSRNKALIINALSHYPEQNQRIFQKRVQF